MKINNAMYRQFLDTGIMQTIKPVDIERALGNVRGKYIREGRALIILLYYTGCRPAEALQLKPSDVTRNGRYISIALLTKKRGTPRSIMLNVQKPWVIELWQYCQSCFIEQYLFFHYRNKYTRHHPDGSTTVEYTDKLRYYFCKWFSHLDGIPPYVLRHNRLTLLSESGATLEEMRWFKGAKDYKSVAPYLHGSTEMGKRLSKKVS